MEKDLRKIEKRKPVGKLNVVVGAWLFFWVILGNDKRGLD